MSEHKKIYDLFLCHNKKDGDLVVLVYIQLRNLCISKGKKMEMWHDEKKIVAGHQLSKEIPDIISQSRVGIIFIGPNGLGDFQKREILMMRAVKLKFIPLLLPGVEEISDDDNLSFLKETDYRHIRFSEDRYLPEYVDQLFDAIIFWLEKKASEVKTHPNNQVVQSDQATPRSRTVRDNDSEIEKTRNDERKIWENYATSMFDTHCRVALTRLLNFRNPNFNQEEINEMHATVKTLIDSISLSFLTGSHSIIDITIQSVMEGKPNLSSKREIKIKEVEQIKIYRKILDLLIDDLARMNDYPDQSISNKTRIEIVDYILYTLDNLPNCPYM